MDLKPLFQTQNHPEQCWLRMSWVKFKASLFFGYLSAACGVQWSVQSFHFTWMWNKVKLNILSEVWLHEGTVKLAAVQFVFNGEQQYNLVGVPSRFYCHINLAITSHKNLLTCWATKIMEHNWWVKWMVWVNLITETKGHNSILKGRLITV